MRRVGNAKDQAHPGAGISISRVLGDCCCKGPTFRSRGTPVLLSEKRRDIAARGSRWFGRRSDSIRPTSVELLNRVVDYAELPEELFVLMSDAECRALMRKALIQCDWFLADEQVKLCALLGMDRSGITIRQDEEMLSSEEEGGLMGRDIRFRLQIVPLYGYSCLLCGVKVLLPSGVTLVEAAHIHQFSKSRNDDVSNGMALCRNHHWSFDQGLWTLSSNYEVLVSLDHFTEAAPNELPLSVYNSRLVDLSRLTLEHQPSQKHLDWHRNQKFLGKVT